MTLSQLHDPLLEIPYTPRFLLPCLFDFFRLVDSIYQHFITLLSLCRESLKPTMHLPESSPDFPFVYFLLTNLFHFQFRLLNPLQLLSMLIILQSNGSHVFFVLISSMYYRKTFACLLFVVFCILFSFWCLTLFTLHLLCPSTCLKPFFSNKPGTSSLSLSTLELLFQN